MGKTSLLPTIIDAGAVILYTIQDRTTAYVKHGVEVLPPATTVDGDLDCRKADGLQPLPADLRVSGLIVMAEIMIDGSSVWCEFDLPETVQAQMIGRRFGDVVSHRLLAGHPIEDALIKNVGIAGFDIGPMVIELDCDACPPWRMPSSKPIVINYDDIPF